MTPLKCGSLLDTVTCANLYTDLNDKKPLLQIQRGFLDLGYFLFKTIHGQAFVLLCRKVGLYRIQGLLLYPSVMPVPIFLPVTKAFVKMKSA
jgi:hypothetical protein